MSTFCRHGRRRLGCRLRTTSHGLLFKFLSAKLQLSQRARTLDEGYVLALAEQVEKSGLDKAVILAQVGSMTTAASPDGTRPVLYPQRLSVSGGSRYRHRWSPAFS